MKNKIILFIGIDGTGKSTVSKNLYTNLSHVSKINKIWWLEGENTYLRKLIRMIFKSNNISEKYAANYSKTKSRKTNFINYIYAFIVVIEYFRFFSIKKIISYFLHDYIIIDRYIYDTLISLKYEFDLDLFKINSNIFKISEYIFGKPLIIFYIDTDPITTYKRRKDEISSLNVQKRNNEIYNNLFNYLKKNDYNIHKIDGNNNLNKVNNDIKKIMSCVI